MAGLVQLELDADDKKSFAEMQQNMAQAEQELGMVSKKMMIREQVRDLCETCVRPVLPLIPVDPFDTR